MHLSPKAHDILVLLVRQAGHLVTKDTFLSQVWPDASVEEGILTVHISALRKAFGEGKRVGGCIETVPRSGYRFVAPVTREQVDRDGVHLRARDERPDGGADVVEGQGPADGNSRGPRAVPGDGDDHFQDLQIGVMLAKRVDVRCLEAVRFVRQLAGQGKRGLFGLAVAGPFGIESGNLIFA